MKRRLFSLLATLMLALAVLPTAPVSAHTGTGVNHTYLGCDTGNSNDNAQAFLYRDQHSWSGYDAARGYLVVPQLYPCSNPISTEDGMDLINVANLVGTSTVVQIGVAACRTGNSGVKCGAYWPDTTGTEYFWYTCDNNMSVCPATWYTADGRGGQPIIGDEYQELVRLYLSGSYFWQYCIQNMSTGSAMQCDDVGITNGVHSGTEVWWGGEVWNEASAMGSLYTDSNGKEYDVSYSPTSSSAWWNATGDSACSQTESSGAEAPLNSYRCGITQYTSGGVGMEYLEVYTPQHN